VLRGKGLLEFDGWMGDLGKIKFVVVMIATYRLLPRFASRISRLPGSERPRQTHVWVSGSEASRVWGCRRFPFSVVQSCSCAIMVHLPGSIEPRTNISTFHKVMERLEW
jgi:hypothetical protein